MLGHEQWWIRFGALVYVVYDFIFFGFVLANVDIPLLKDNLNNGLLRIDRKIDRCTNLQTDRQTDK